MNRKLFEKVKTKCTDTGLSEKYLQAITEKMGGSIEDDSTDDEAIETTANLIAEVAKESQRGRRGRRKQRWKRWQIWEKRSGKRRTESDQERTG